MKKEPNIGNDQETRALLARFEHERNLESYKTENEMRRFNCQIYQESQNILLKQTIILGQNALKMALLINGGSGVAMQAFLGGMVSKGLVLNCDLTKSLFCFSLGVLLSAISSGTAYLSQALYNSAFDKTKNKAINDMNKGIYKNTQDDEGDAGEIDRNHGNQMRIISIVFAIACYVLFAAGIWNAYGGLLILQNIKQ